MNKKEKRLHSSRRLYILFFINLLIIAGVFCAKSTAEAENTASLEDVKKNVFRLETICMVNEKEYPVKSATCFLIGDVEMEQEQYIVSTNQVLAVSDKEKKAIRKKYKIKKDQELTITYRVVVSSDITLDAVIKTQAQDNDYAVLQLASSLVDRRGIALGDIHQMEQNQEVILLGYTSEENEINLYTSEVDSQKTDEEKVTYQGALLSKADYGAPIVDGKGALLGMNVYIDEKGKYATGIAVNELRKVFDMLDINYQSADSKYSELGEMIKESEKAANDSSYKASSVEELQEAIAQAKNIYTNMESTNEEYKKEITALDKAMKALKPKSDTYHMIMIVLAIVAAGIIVVIIAVMLKNGKKRSEIHYMNEDKKTDLIKADKKTTKIPLPVSGGELAASSVKAPSAYLIHKTSGERIAITKAKFVVGSQIATVDYCISNNRSISRNHAFILNQNGTFFVQDNHSLNHTYLNGRQLNAYENEVIRNQDVIRFANVEYIFEIQ